MVVTSYSLNCMMCGRSSGLVRRGVFYRATTAPSPERRGGRSRCGFCGGNLYLEPDDSALIGLASDLQKEGRKRLAS
jgi:hypothetical protein